MKFTGLLGVARASMQLDVGLGDAVVPKPVDVEVPTLLDFPAPKLLGYQRDTSIAEKFHAMVVLGTINGRMKDFYDIWLLAQNFEFAGEQLAQAIKATFGTRTTLLESDPVALTPAFAESAEAQKRWAAFLKKSALTSSFFRSASATRSVVAVLRSCAARKPVQSGAQPVANSTARRQLSLVSSLNSATLPR